MSIKSVRICEECTEHRLVYDSVTSRERCECSCHKESEIGCPTDPCCR